MAKLLVEDVIESVQKELSQIAGVATNVYGTPRILQHIQDAYLELIEEFGDRTLQKYHDVTLDGTTGVIDADLAAQFPDDHIIDRFEDIIAVWLDGSNRPLPILPAKMNVRLITGDTARYIEANPTTQRPFVCYPITATGDLVVLTRDYPILPLTEASYIYIDAPLVIYRAAYLYAEDDATAVGAIGKFEKLSEQRKMQLKNANNNQGVLLDPRMGSVPDQWMER